MGPLTSNFFLIYFLNVTNLLVVNDLIALGKWELTCAFVFLLPTGKSSHGLIWSLRRFNKSIHVKYLEQHLACQSSM